MLATMRGLQSFFAHARRALPLATNIGLPHSTSMKSTRSLLPAVIAIIAAFASGWVAHASQAGKAMAEADAQLNVLYKKLMAAMPGASQKDKLKTAQRAWVAWIEAEVEFEQALLMDGKAGLFARLEPTEARNKQFEDLLARSDEYQR